VLLSRLLSKEDKKWINWQWERLKSAFKFWEQYEGVKYTNPSYFGLSSVEMSKTWQYCGNWTKLCHLCRDMHCQFAGAFTEKELKKNERIRHAWWRPITFRYFVLGQFKVQKVFLKSPERPEFVTPQLWDYLKKMPYRIFKWERPYNMRGEEFRKD